MKYASPNTARGCSVHDVEGREVLTGVVSVDTAKGIVECAEQPARLDWTGEQIEKYQVRFKTIYPIFAGSRYPLMFHCYGKQP